MTQSDAAANPTETGPYGSSTAPAAASHSPRVVRTHTLQQWKADNAPWAMLTAYDHLTASIFDEAGIPVLLVGDSAANVVLGYDTTLEISMDEMIMLTASVARGARRALVVADLPFGSYHESPEQAIASAARFMKEAGAHAVKLEGGVHMAPTIARLTQAGIPVMAHIGFTPQAEHALGGFRVQGRGDTATAVVADAQAVADAGAFSVVMEMVPNAVAAEVTRTVACPTIGIGAGPDCDAQVLVWQDMAGMYADKRPRFVKQYAAIREELLGCARTFADEVAAGKFPAEEHQFLT